MTCIGVSSGCSFAYRILDRPIERGANIDNQVPNGFVFNAAPFLHQDKALDVGRFDCADEGLLTEMRQYPLGEVPTNPLPLSSPHAIECRAQRPPRETGSFRVRARFLPLERPVPEPRAFSGGAARRPVSLSAAMSPCSRSRFSKSRFIESSNGPGIGFSPRSQ